jgi:membrane-bound lytic murein transglycosylase MltF
MQESSCNPSAVGGAGEQGLMQITREKCKGAPNGNCKDIVSFLYTISSLRTDLLSSGLQYQDRS